MRLTKTLIFIMLICEVLTGCGDSPEEIYSDDTISGCDSNSVLESIFS